MVTIVDPSPDKQTAPRSSCPVCGEEPTRATVNLCDLVSEAYYVDLRGHMWSMRWLVAA